MSAKVVAGEGSPALDGEPWRTMVCMATTEPQYYCGLLLHDLPYYLGSNGIGGKS